MSTSRAIPALSHRDSPHFETSSHQRDRASAFTQGAQRYHDIRPGYSAAIMELLPSGWSDGLILDMGCGTGKLTQLLARYSAPGHLLGMDLSLDMLQQFQQVLPDVPCWQATIEDTSLASDTIRTLTCAQTWHWVDPATASAEMARITKPQGTLLLVWNSLDVTHPWVHRLSRIMHSGDTLKKGFIPDVREPWHLDQEYRGYWYDYMTADQIIELTHTRSYWLRSPQHIREKVDKNLRWYLLEHLGYIRSDTIRIPYRVDAFSYTKK